MHLFLDKNLAANYQSPSQVARVLTESWLQQNIYCPSCGNEAIESFQNNQPVADFFCSQCHEEYELKSNVEISYLFQFDRIEHSNYTEIKIEIFHNGMDEAFIQNNILNVIQSHLPNVHYYFD